MNKKLSQLLSTAKDKIDWIMIIVGFCMASYSLLSFKASIFSVREQLAIHVSRLDYTNGFYYCYSKSSKFLFVIGIGLLALGVLLHKNKK